MTDATERRFWIGRVRDDTDILVFDSQRQGSDSTKVRFFSLDLDDWRTFVLSIVQKRVQQEHEPEVIRRAVDAYFRFERELTAREEAEAKERSARLEEGKREADAWFRRREEAAQALVLSMRERAQALNRVHLSKHGIASFEYRVRSAERAVRVTHCWACKGHLESTRDLEHVRCGWLICDCGACGCGWHAA